jgi:hypothetical protein
MDVEVRQRPPSLADDDGYPTVNESLLEPLLACLAGRLLLHFPEQAFLQQLAASVISPLPDDPLELAQQLATVSDHLLQCMTEDERQFDPLVCLIQNFGLSQFELDLLLLAVAPELDERFGDLYAGINGGLRRLAMHQAIPLLVADSADRRVIRDMLHDSALWRSGLLVDNASTTLFERRLQADRALGDHIGERAPLSSLAATVHYPTSDPTATFLAGTMAAINTEAGELAAWLDSGAPCLLHLVDAGIDTAVESAGVATRYIDTLSIAVQQPWLELRLSSDKFATQVPQLLVAARLADLLPVLRLGVDRGEVELTAAMLGPLVGPLVVVGADSVVLRVPQGFPLRRWRARPPRPLEQVPVWQHFLSSSGGRSDAEIDLLANQSHLSVNQIAAVVTLASARAEIDGRSAASHDDVLQALREHLPDPVSQLASSYRPQVPWSALVLDRKARANLERLVERLRYRIEVQDRWGLGAARFGNRGNGLVALLHGESGTGKTFAAQAIAHRLGMPMLSVDLSRVVSKYIGETEKNLNQLFELGEGFRCLLFFDEADALFGKRTGVKDAHDRYANIEVNFLLQRLETFEGLVLLASNFQQSMDDAFTRRIGFSVFFPRPTPGQRMMLWRQHLPPERLADDIPLERIAERFELVGGEIRNCALNAAYAAAADQGIISQAMLEAAIASEFTKMGRPQPRGIGPPK